MFPRIYTIRKGLYENATWVTHDLRDSMTYNGFANLCNYLTNSGVQAVNEFTERMRDYFSDVTVNGVKIGEMSPDLAIKHIIAGLIYGRIPNERGNLNTRCKKITNDPETIKFFEKLNKYTDLLFEKACVSLEEQTKESKALDLSGKAVVASDIHCDYNEMMQIIKKSEGVDHIIFSGDTLGHSYITPEDTYITMFTMLLHQICDPRVKFLRGNHEVTTLLDYTDTGLRDNPYLRQQIQSVWNRMPICARVKTIAPEVPVAQAAAPAQQMQQSQSVFVSHAGIPRKAITFEELRELPVMKQIEITSAQILESKTQGSGQVVFDMLYSDPGETEQHQDRSAHLGFSSVFSNSHIDKLSGTQYSEFAAKTGITTFVRGHSHPLAGVARDGEKLLTVASSSKLEESKVQAKVIVIDGDIKYVDTRVNPYIQKAQVIPNDLAPDSHRSGASPLSTDNDFSLFVAQLPNLSEQDRKLLIEAIKNVYKLHLKYVSPIAARSRDVGIVPPARLDLLLRDAIPLLSLSPSSKKIYQSSLNHYIINITIKILETGVPLEDLASKNHLDSLCNLLGIKIRHIAKQLTDSDIYDEVRYEFLKIICMKPEDLAEYSTVDALDYSTTSVEASIKSKSTLLSICESARSRSFKTSAQHEYLTRDGFLVPKIDLSTRPDASVLDDGAYLTGWLPWINVLIQIEEGKRPAVPLPDPVLSDILQSETAHPYGESVALYQDFIEKFFKRYSIDINKKEGAIRLSSYAYKMYHFIINADTFREDVFNRYGFSYDSTSMNSDKATMLRKIRNWNFTEAQITKAKEFVLDNIGLSERDFFRKLQNDNSGAFPSDSSLRQRKYLADAAFSRIIAEFPIYTIDRTAIFTHNTQNARGLLGVSNLSEVKIGHEFTPSTFLCTSNGSIAHHDTFDSTKIRVVVPPHTGFIPAAADFFEASEVRFPIHLKFKVIAIDSVSGVITVEPCNLPEADISSKIVQRMLHTQDAFHSRPETQTLHRTVSRGAEIKITDRLSIPDEIIIPEILKIAGNSDDRTKLQKINELLTKYGIDPDLTDLTLIRQALATSKMKFVLNLPRNLSICCSESLRICSLLDVHDIIIKNIQEEIRATQRLIDIYKERVSEIEDTIANTATQLLPLEIRQRQEILDKLKDRIEEFTSDLPVLNACKEMCTSSDFTNMLTNYNALVSKGSNFEKVYAYQMFKAFQTIMNDENLRIEERNKAILQFNALKLVLIRNNIIGDDCNLTLEYDNLKFLISDVDDFTVSDWYLLRLANDNINRVEVNSLEDETMFALDLISFCHKLKKYLNENCDKMSGENKAAMMEQLILPIQKSIIVQIERLIHILGTNIDPDSDKAVLKKQHELDLVAHLITQLESLKQYIKLVEGDAGKQLIALKEISLVYKKLIDRKYHETLPARDKEEFLQDARKYVFETCVSLPKATLEEERNLFNNLLAQIEGQVTFVLSDRSQKGNLYSSFVGKSTKFTVDGTKTTQHIIKDTLNRESRRFDEVQARKALKALELEFIKQKRSLDPWEYRSVALKSLGSDGYKERGMVREFMDRAEKCGLISKMPNSDLTASATYDILRARGRLHPIGLSPERAQKTLEWIGQHLKESGHICEGNLIEFVRSIGSTRGEAARIFAELSAADSNICRKGTEYTSPSLVQQSIESRLAIHPPNQGSNALAAPPALALDAAAAVAQNAQPANALGVPPPPPPIETAAPPAPIQTSIDWHRLVVPVNMG